MLCNPHGPHTCMASWQWAGSHRVLRPRSEILGGNETGVEWLESYDRGCLSTVFLPRGCWNHLLITRVKYHISFQDTGYWTPLYMEPLLYGPIGIETSHLCHERSEGHAGNESSVKYQGQTYIIWEHIGWIGCSFLLIHVCILKMTNHSVSPTTPTRGVRTRCALFSILTIIRS